MLIAAIILDMLPLALSAVKINANETADEGEEVVGRGLSLDIM